MSFINHMPIKAARRVSWRNVVGLDQDDVALFDRVRAAQMAVVNGYLPFNIGVTLLNMAALAYAMQGHVRHVAFLWWTGALFALGLVWLGRFLRRRGQPRHEAVSRRAFLRVNGELVLFGLPWVMAVVLMMPEASVSEAIILVLMTSTAMASTGFGLAVLPLAGIVVTWMFCVAVVLAIPAGSPVDTPVAYLALVSVALQVTRGTLVTTFALTSRLMTERDLAASDDVVRMMLNEFEVNGSDWLLETDRKSRFTVVSARFAQVAGRSRSWLMGRTFLDMMEPEVEVEAESGTEAVGAQMAGLLAMRRHFKAREPFRDLVLQVRVDEEMRFWAFSATPKFEDGGKFSGYRGVGRDITEIKRSQERIAMLGRFDPLTGLANRTLFQEDLGEALKRAKLEAGQAALLFVDLDHFKRINDGLGHAVGDRLLIAVAERLRKLAPDGVTVARLGGMSLPLWCRTVRTGRRRNWQRRFWRGWRSRL